jgi:hypothetical protein
MVTLKANRAMLISGSIVCGVVVVGLSLFAILCWQHPKTRDDVFPLVVFFDLVFAYRLYRYVKLIPPRKISS